MTVTAGVVGAAGYAGVELVRLLLNHPHFELQVITSKNDAGVPLQELYPAFTEKTDLVFSDHDDSRLLQCDVVFLAVPHTAALAQVPHLLTAGITVIDLSADYRLTDPELYQRWYGTKHSSPELLHMRTFGLPELFYDELARAHKRRVRGEAVLVGCAGCYPTATSLAAAPAIRAGWVEGIVVVDAISGVTGAGRAANLRTHFCSASGNLEAYSVAQHRHIPEIEQILGIEDRLVFTPHLAPLNRGLLSTVHLNLNTDVSLEEVQSCYRDFYKGSAFVSVLPLGNYPRTDAVVGTNTCQVGLALREVTRTLSVISAIDNLCKGAAGQAIQCANIVCGFEETSGLPLVALPV